MKWRIVFLILGWIAATGAVWQGFALWDSYANSTYERHWVGHQFSANGSLEGHWEWEEGPLDTTVSQRYIQLVYPLTNSYATYVEGSEMPMVMNTIKESRFSEMKIYWAEDFFKWLDADGHIPPDALGRPFHVFATRHYSIPFQWLPPSLMVMGAAIVFLISGSYGRVRSIIGLLSLIIAACLVVLWCRSFGKSVWTPKDAVAYVRQVPGQYGKFNGVAASNGSFLIQSEEIWGMAPPFPGWSLGSDASFRASYPGFAGFGFLHFKSFGIDSGGEGWTLAFPIWIPIIAALLYPTFVVKRMVKRVIRKPSQCRVCGYDMRATPEQCPECGTGVVLKREGIQDE